MEKKIDDARHARSMANPQDHAVFSDDGSPETLYYTLNGKAVYPATESALLSHICRLVSQGVKVDARRNPLVARMLQQVLDEQNTPPERPHDAVDAPKHYRLPGLEVEWIHVRAALTRTIPPLVPHEIAGDWREAITYLARMWQKNGLEDAKKALFYLTKMIDEMKGDKPDGRRMLDK